MTERSKRIRWTHTRIASGSFPNECRIAEKFGISERQARRDIAYMREKLGAPIEYDYAAKGFRYTAPFELPASVTESNDDEYVGLAAKLRTGVTESIGGEVQLQIPYMAEIETRDKLALLELKSFITSSSPKKHRYVCEFHSVDLFLGIVMTLNAEIRIVSPDWIRERALSSAEKIIRANS